ncbi:dihydrofolate reductase [Burkholderia gladioli]|uniref:dihydrofolate reductase n=1 Tax=Burkholderia gladioli TaxID=28095 RepID=UPI003C7BBC2C
MSPSGQLLPACSLHGRTRLKPTRPLECRIKATSRGLHAGGKTDRHGGRDGGESRHRFRQGHSLDDPRRAEALPRTDDGTVAGDGEADLRVDRQAPAWPGRGGAQFARRGPGRRTACFEALVDIIRDDPRERVLIGGGQQIYERFLPFADVVHLTEIDLQVPGDTFFPTLPARFTAVDRIEIDGAVAHAFVTYASASPGGNLR